MLVYEGQVGGPGTEPLLATGHRVHARIFGLWLAIERLSAVPRRGADPE